MNFSTIVTHINNAELRKDTGQIPYQLHKLFNYNSTLVSFYYSKNGETVKVPDSTGQKINVDYPYLKSETDGLKLIFLNNTGRGKFYDRAIIKFLKKKSRSIDILNLFHFTTDTILYTLIYKIINPKGKVYVKLDIDINYYDSKKYFFNTGEIFPELKVFGFNHFILPLFFRLVHTISAESKAGLKYFTERFNPPPHKMFLLLNGIDEKRISDYKRSVTGWEEKENMIISVGRIGNPQKNNTMLMQSIPLLKLKDWKVYFIGPQEKGFEQDVANYFERYPELKDRVFFTGNLTDPNELYKYYSRAKIFCLTSAHEGFPIAACEASGFGNFMVLTDMIYCFNELTNYGDFGRAVKLDDINGLATTLQQLINDEDFLKEKFELILNYFHQELTWQSIIPKLHNRFNGKE